MYIAIDIGGTNTRVGVSHDSRRFYATYRFKTPKTAQDGLNKIIGIIKQFKGERKLHKIAVAVPTPVSDGRKTRLNFPNLPGWRSIPLGNTLAKALHTKVYLVNDATAAGLGEATKGAGYGYDVVAYLTLSTGIGGVRIHQGIADGAAQGFEPGHHILVVKGKKCPCGQSGCFEAYASGTAFYKTYKLRPEFCKSKTVWAKHAQTVGHGLINTIVHWSPDVVVLGGGLTQAGPLLFKPLNTFVKTHLKILKAPPIIRGSLGDDAGLYGCLELLR